MESSHFFAKACSPYVGYTLHRENVIKMGKHLFCFFQMIWQFWNENIKNYNIKEIISDSNYIQKKNIMKPLYRRKISFINYLEERYHVGTI